MQDKRVRIEKNAPGAGPVKPDAAPEIAAADTEDRVASAGEKAAKFAAVARAKTDRLQAHADKFFSTDEEMPLGPHILLFTIVAFFAVGILWANLATIDELTRGEGKVIPSSEVQHLQSLERRDHR